MIRSVIFDMDGLMFDTERLSSDAWIEVGKRHGFPITRELLKEMIGKRVEDCVHIFNRELGEDFDYWTYRKERLQLTNETIAQNGVPMKPGLKALLSWLKEHNYRISLATSTNEEIARDLLKKAAVLEYFDYFVCGNMVKKGKPDPEVFLRAAEGLNTPPGECLVLEDSYMGVEAGARAGCQVIMIPDQLPAREIDKRRTVACLENLFQVIDFLKGCADHEEMVKLKRFFYE